MFIKKHEKKYGMKKGQFHSQKHVIICSFSGRVFRMSPPPLQVAHLPVDILSNDFDVYSGNRQVIALVTTCPDLPHNAHTIVPFRKDNVGFRQSGDVLWS